MKQTASELANWSRRLKLGICCLLLSYVIPSSSQEGGCTKCIHEDRPMYLANGTEYICAGMPKCIPIVDSLQCLRCSVVTIYTCTKPGYPDRTNRDYDCTYGEPCGPVVTVDCGYL